MVYGGWWAANNGGSFVVYFFKGKIWENIVIVTTTDDADYENGWAPAERNYQLFSPLFFGCMPAPVMKHKKYTLENFSWQQLSSNVGGSGA